MQRRRLGLALLGVAFTACASRKAGARSATPAPAGHRVPSPTSGPVGTPRPPAPASQALLPRVAAPTAAPGSAAHGQPPELGGQRLTLKGRDVQLPPDAYAVGAGIVDYFPGVGPTPAPDADREVLILQRGRSRITLGVPSGTILREDLAPGEEGAFAFLRAALQ